MYIIKQHKPYKYNMSISEKCWSSFGTLTDRQKVIERCLHVFIWW